MTGDGIDGISTMIGGAREQYPGHRFELVSGPDSHHDRVRFSWSLTPDGGEPIAIGVDFATVTDDGRMRSITGFLEPARVGAARPGAPRPSSPRGAGGREHPGQLGLQHRGAVLVLPTTAERPK